MACFGLECFGSELKKPSIDDYEMGPNIGSGHFAEVRSCVENKTGQVFALKCIRAQVSEMENIDNEIRILSALDHPNIVSLKSHFTGPGMVYMVMEYVTGGELFHRIVDQGHFSEKLARDVVRDISEALVYLHERKIVHRDLKPENLLLESPTTFRLKVADFGLACLTNGKGANKTCGTPVYVAPEIVNQEVYGAPVDMWSLGVITYILLCGFPPFYDDHLPTLFDQIRHGSFDFPSPYWDTISDSAKDLINKLLTVDPNKRYTAKQVLKHPWMKSGDVNDDLLNANMTKFRDFNARRKLKKAGRGVLAMVKMKRLASATHSQSAKGE